MGNRGLLLSCVAHLSDDEAHQSPSRRGNARALFPSVQLTLFEQPWLSRSCRPSGESRTGFSAAAEPIPSANRVIVAGTGCVRLGAVHAIRPPNRAAATETQCGSGL